MLLFKILNRNSNLGQNVLERNFDLFLVKNVLADQVIASEHNKIACVGHKCQKRELVINLSNTALNFQWMEHTHKPKKSCK